MKRIKFISLAITILCLNCLILACNNNDTKSKTDNKTTNNQDIDNNNSDTLPDIIKNDSLINKYLVVVADTFDDGQPLKINYCDPINTNEIKYEKQFYHSGKLFMEGPLNNGRRDGKWIAWYENGVIWSVGYFKEGLKHGASKVFYENGQVRYTKNYEEDVAEGLWEFFDENGEILGKIMYENGELLWQEGATE